MTPSRNLTRFVLILLLGGMALPALARGQDPDERDRRRAERQTRVQKSEEERELEKQLRIAAREFQAAARRLQELQAQARSREAEARASEMAELFQVAQRGRLGVVVDTTPEGAAGPDGVRGAVVVAVTPGTPAEEAGLRAGDVIIRMNGEELTGEAPEGRSAAALEIIRRTRGLKPGDEVRLEYLRDGRPRSVVLEAGAAAGPRFNFIFSPKVEIPPIHVEAWPYALLEPGPSDEETLQKWREFELVELNPELGRYFGSGKGVLVIRAPKEPPLDVRAGDVIIGIGDSETNTPIQAFRSLRSVRPGERIDVKVLRNRNVVTVRTVVPSLPSQTPPGKKDD